MNTDPMARTGNTTGQRLRMLAVGVCEAIGIGSLLTVAAVEGGAALKVDSPMVEPAAAGTGITGLEIGDSGCGAGEFSRLVVLNNKPQDINLTLTDKSNGQSVTVIQGAKQRNTYPYARGTTIESRIKQAPGEVDVQTVCAEAPTSTTSSTTITTTITHQPTTTTTTSTPNFATTTTTSPNTIISVPRGHDVEPPVTSGPTTTTINSADGGYANKPTGNESTFSQNTTTATTKIALPTAPQTGRQLALTGKETLKTAAGGAALTAIGVAFVILSRRKKQQAAA